jgi:hypothetical protein
LSDGRNQPRGSQNDFLADFRAFDKLPKEFRELIRNRPNEYDAVAMQQFINECTALGYNNRETLALAKAWMEERDKLEWQRTMAEIEDAGRRMRQKIGESARRFINRKRLYSRD